ncbi:MAG: DUF1631 domain-containing protein [Spongiibacteraceae bacterium]
MTGPRSKVVPFKPGAGGAGKQKDGMMDVPSAPLQRLQERCKPLLQQLVQALFDHADDALFELADKAVSNIEQNLYFESMREVRIKRRGIEQALVRDLLEAFRCLGLGIEVENSGPSTADEQAPSSLALVDHDELEEMVAIDGMIAKAEKEYGHALVALNARLETLVNGFAVTLKTNPVAPARLCNSFLEATHTLELDIKAKLVLFKLFDRHVIKDLGAVYDAANALLVDEGVLPRMRRGARTAAPNPGYSAAADSEAEQVFEGLQQLLNQARPQHAQLHSDQRTGLMAPGLAPALPRDALMQLLGSIQQQQISWLAQQQSSIMRGVAPQQFDVLQVLNQLLQRKLPNHVVSIGQVDDDAINLVSMLFQFIIEDRNLAAPIKGLLARLQIPILKVAMLDKTFFSKGGHPARKLLNEVANASLGWIPTGAVERDPFYIKIEAVVERVVNDFSSEVDLFQDVLTDFIAFVEMDRRRATLVEQRTIDAEDGRAKSELARITVQEAIDLKVGGAQLPEAQLPDAVRRLLNDGWSNVLFLICLKEGTDSESWQLGLRTVDDLLESVSSVDTLVDRARLLRMLPTLLKNLRSGLSKIGFNPFEMNQLFADLEQIHLQRLRREDTASLVASEPDAEVAPVVAAAPVIAVVEPAPVEVAKAAEPVARPAVVVATVAPKVAAKMPAESRTLDEVLDGREQMQTIETLERELAEQLGAFTDLDHADLEHDDGTKKLLANLAPEFAAVAPVAEILPDTDRDLLARIDHLQVGGWVELQQDGHPVRCRLAAVIRATGKYIFVNRAGIKVAENNREGLLQAYKAGVLNILDDGRLFDRALESVIGNLREMKGRHPG